MESRLLSGFYDDHFDDNYIKYEIESAYWPEENTSLGLQLTETLDGILPISPAEVNNHCFENDTSSTFVLNEYENNLSLNYSKNLDTNAYSLIDNTSRPAIDNVIEVISVDPNCEYDSSSTTTDSNNENSDNDDDDQLFLTVNNENNDDIYYRNRTESSSIGDYESHSSDDDDEEESDEFDDNIMEDKNNSKITNNCNIKIKNEKNFIEHDMNSDKNNKTILHINDLENIKDFNLTKFIIQDDHDTKTTIMNDKLIKTEYPDIKSDEDSDVDIDVETIQEIEFRTEFIIKSELENDYNDNNFNIHKSSKTNRVSNYIQIEDDLIKDPSWSPPRLKKVNNKTKNNEISRKNKLKNNTIIAANNPGANSNTNTNMNSNSNNKITKICNNNKPKMNSTNESTTKQQSSVILERKVYGIGRGGKNISICSKEPSSSPPSKVSLKTDQSHNKSYSNNSRNLCDIKNSKVVNKVEMKEMHLHNQSTKEQKFSTEKTLIDIKKCKNDSITKNESSLNSNNNKISCSQEEKQQISQKITLEKSAINVLKEICSPLSFTQNTEIKMNSTIANDHDYYEMKPPLQLQQQILPVKKKLNLEEYKKRRGVSTAGGDVINIANKNQIKLPENEKLNQIKMEPQNIDLPPMNSLKQNSGDLINSSPTIQTPNLNLTPGKKMILEKLEKNSSIDPITEAKNKVLRMKELKKKAALDRIIDSTVSAKVGPVTKILPLEEIVKNSKILKCEDKIPKKIDMNEYEEIIVVSVSLNTDLTIPPESNRLKNYNCDGKVNGINGASLFYNISDTLQKANSIESIKISSSSLISSIQDIALKKLNTTVLPKKPKTTTKANVVNQKQTMSPTNRNCKESESTTTVNVETSTEHGEDKIIMHLRKDRIRMPKQSSSTQTLMLPQFPPLQLLSTLDNDRKLIKASEKRRRRKYRSRHSSLRSSINDEDVINENSYHSSHSSSHHSSSSSLRKRSRRNSYRANEIDPTVMNNDKLRHRSKSKESTLSTSSESGIGQRGRSRERQKRQRRYSSTSPGGSSTHSRSNSSSDRSRSNHSSRSRSLSTSSSSSSRSRSSSRSSYSRSKSNRFKDHRSRSGYRRNQRNVSPAVEERRIVYVGRIEQETSKEDLKRKFITYGPIRQITLHYKDTGMKYGFVTYEKAQDAFKAIDNGTKDPKINMYDISFGGRRQFCGATYSDLDGVVTNSLQMCSYPPKVQTTKEDSFEALLAKVKEKLCNNKKSSSSSTSSSLSSHRNKT